MRREAPNAPSKKIFKLKNNTYYMRNTVVVHRRTHNKERLEKVLKELPVVVKADDGTYPLVRAGTMASSGMRYYYLSIEGPFSIKVTDKENAILRQNSEGTQLVHYSYSTGERTLGYNFFVNPPSLQASII